jgi:hypothetical protein
MLVQLCTLPWLGFVPARYDGYLEKARKSGEDTAYRHYWELCVTLCLRDGLRSGDVFVPGSRRYADPSTYLYTPAAVIDRIAADVDELARAWRVQDLTTAAVLPGPRAERRRRLAEPDLEFRAFCTRRRVPASSTPQLERAWDAWQAERYQRGEISQRPGYTGNPFRPR